MMEQLVQHLKVLGFTEMESKMLIVLTEQGSMSGYEVAKRLGVSRSNVYAALQKLVDNGFVLCSKGEPTHYTVLRVEELTRMIGDQLQNSIRHVEQLMPKQSNDVTEFFSLDSEKKVIERVRQELGRAQQEIIVDVWAEEATLFREDLEQAEKRGVKVFWSVVESLEEHRQRRMQLQLHSSLEGDTSQADQPYGRKFSIVIDRKWSMLGMRGEDIPTKALVTEHPALLELLLNHFAQELVLFEVEQELGPELRERFGTNFEGIYRKYFQSGLVNVK